MKFKKELILACTEGNIWTCGLNLIYNMSVIVQKIKLTEAHEERTDCLQLH